MSKDITKRQGHTSKASKRAIVSGLSYFVFPVNQWMIWKTKGLNSCSATYKTKHIMIYLRE